VAVRLTSTDLLTTGSEDVNVIIEQERVLPIHRKIAVDGHVEFMAELGAMGEGAVEDDGQDGIHVDSDTCIAKIGQSMTIEGGNGRRLAGLVTWHLEQV
jgi:hypothetical protein